MEFESVISEIAISAMSSLIFDKIGVESKNFAAIAIWRR